MSVAEDIQNIFRRVLNSSHLVLKPEHTAWDVQGWDSLAHMHLLLEVERHFGVQFSSAESLRLKCVADLQSLVETKLKVR